MEGNADFIGLENGYVGDKGATAQKRLLSALRDAWCRAGDIAWPTLQQTLEDLQATRPKRKRDAGLDVCVSSHTSDHPWPMGTKFICPICEQPVEPYNHPKSVHTSHLVHSQQGPQYWRVQLETEMRSLFDKLLQDCPTFYGPERLPFTALKTPQLAILTCANCNGTLLTKVSFWRDGDQWVVARSGSAPHPVPTWLAKQFSRTPRMDQVLRDHKKVIDFFAFHGLEMRGAADEDGECSDFDWADQRSLVKVEPLEPDMPLQEKLLRWDVELPSRAHCPISV
eukprot:TRINITY_DN85847_c0_g1_i1.p1 TRINITY_DN85847_c0_g1~~TRINITY_DN85847_c0_g1_i1.p1  ORF type:complete len:282 (-),score=25.05 TRINITY_DN85847_c0_g1_i1:104-949(-)